MLLAYHSRTAQYRFATEETLPYEVIWMFFIVWRDSFAGAGRATGFLSGLVFVGKDTKYFRQSLHKKSVSLSVTVCIRQVARLWPIQL